MSDLPPVSKERTGWRDERISHFHKSLGWNAPLVDIDFLGIEYTSGEPVCIIDYKLEFARIDLTNASIRALSRLGDRADLPSYIVRYGNDLDWFEFIALNGIGRKVLMGLDRKMMSPRQYCTYMYYLRGTKPPADVLAKFCEKKVAI